MKFSIITIISALWILVAVPMKAQQTTSVTSVSALEKVRSLPTKEERNETAVLYTVPAEELNTIAPELVQKRNEILPSPHARQPQMTQQRTIHSVDHAAMIPLLVKAIQEQQAEIDCLRNEMSALKAQARK